MCPLWKPVLAGRGRCVQFGTRLSQLTGASGLKKSKCRESFQDGDDGSRDMYAGIRVRLQRFNEKRSYSYERNRFLSV